jgi:hypothetical protein
MHVDDDGDDQYADDTLLVDPDRPRVVRRSPLRPFAQVLPALMQHVDDECRAGRTIVKSIWVCMALSQSSRVSAWRTFKRWLARRIAGPFDHIEVLVVMSNGQCRPYTVDQHDPRPSKAGSGFVRRPIIDPTDAYPPERWVTCELTSLDIYEAAGISYFLERQLGKPMDSSGMYWNFLLPMFVWMPSTLEQDAYFCSHLVAAALRWVRPQQFAGVNPLKCTPYKLYRLLRERGDIAHSAGSRASRQREQLAEWKNLEGAETF